MNDSQEIIDHTYQILKAEGLHDWHLEIMDLGKIKLGFCVYVDGHHFGNAIHGKTILLDAEHTKGATLEQLKKTIAHEVAHVLTMGDGHGSRWKAHCLRLGGTGETKTNVNDATHKKRGHWQATCGVCDELHAYHRKPKDLDDPQAYSCLCQDNLMKAHRYNEVTFLKFIDTRKTNK